MEEWMIPGQVIGIIGEGVEAYYLTQAALSMGYKVFIYNTDEADMAGSVSDEHWMGFLTDREQLKLFAQNCDLLLYTTKNIGNDMVRMMMNETYIPQADEVLSLAQDKALQKASFDSLNINISPYTTVLSKEDVKKAADRTGYPALISNNFSYDYYNTDQYILNGEEDIAKLDDQLLQSTAVMEAYIKPEKNLSIVVAVDVFGNVHPVSLSETTYRNNRLRSSINPPQIDSNLALEAYRITHLIAKAFSFVGILTLDFIISDLGILYVKELNPFTSNAGVNTLDGQNYSQYELFIRAATHWEIPPVEHYESVLSIPFYFGEDEKMIERMRKEPQAKLYYYNETRSEAPHGHVSFLSEDYDFLISKIEG